MNIGKIKSTVKSVAGKTMMASTAAATAIMTAGITTPVYAADPIAGLNQFKTFLITVCGVVGAIIIVVGIIKFAMKGEERDQSDYSVLMKSIIAGGLCAGVAVVLGWLGM